MMRQRKRNRKRGFDYSSAGIYFLTVCCKNRIHWLGQVNNHLMELNQYGAIVQQQIKWLPQQYPYLTIHNFVVMPNHVHLLCEIVGPGRNVAGTGRNLSLPKIKSISELMGAFKTTSSKQIHLAGNVVFGWQRSFHDHIVRSSESYERIDAYITQNPAKWDDDQLNKPENQNSG